MTQNLAGKMKMIILYKRYVLMWCDNIINKKLIIDADVYCLSG